MESLTSEQLTDGQQDWPVQMQRALDLASSVLSTYPNPRVGCVLVKNGQVLAEGWHQAPGEAHAEAMALREASDRGVDVSGATAIVTLEPCAHHGRTGPCCEALIKAKVKSVVLAGVDPNPEVAGKGIQAMEAAGISVFHLREFEQQAEALNRGYFKRRRRGLPWLTVKLAMSLDGRTAMVNGESKWITGAGARADVQRLRLRSSAIITGIGTVLADDPSLNVRVEELRLNEKERALNSRLLDTQPLRVVIDSELRTPGTAKIVSLPGRCVIYTKSDANDFQANESGAPEMAEVSVRPLSSAVESSARGVDLRSVLESLAAEYEANEVLVEAGPKLAGKFLEAGLVDELIVYVAPKLMGSDARPLMDIAGLNSLDESIELEWQSVDAVGQDLRLTLRPKRRAAS